MEYVQTETRLGSLADELAGERLVAADTEAAGYHRYVDRGCLLQLSTRKRTYVVDTLSVGDLGALTAVLADPATEVVFHDADYDLRLLHRDFGMEVRGLFDTRIAAQFLGEPAVGLSSLLEKYLHVRVEKKHQRADWARRPLPKDMLEYAVQDTVDLPRLRDLLREELAARERLAWAEEEFALQERVRWAPPDGEAGYLRLKGTYDLRPRQLAALRALFAWREGLARDRDLAPFRVMGNVALIELARRMPDSAAGLAEVPGMPRRLMVDRTDEVLALLEQVRRLPESELPVRQRSPRRPPPEPDLEARLERLKQVRDAAAEALGLDRGFLMPRGQLEELARRQPESLETLVAVPGVRRWQVEALGDELLAAISD